MEASPVEIAERCASLPGMVFFDSALENGESFSIIAACPRETLTGDFQKDWFSLRKKIRSYRRDYMLDYGGVPMGFAGGYIGYDGKFCFGFYENLLVYRHSDQSWFEVGMLPVPEATGTQTNSRLKFKPTLEKAEFCAMIEAAKEYIAAGDIYQVNLAYRFESPWNGNAFGFYEALRHYSPAPYAAYMNLGDRCILSSSPELFLKISGREIVTRPIKGTRPRFADTDADERSAYDLLTSPKEVAELIMITDLERNDLGRICEFGTVEARELLKLERYEQVFHLVSTVAGELREEIDPVTALHHCFPGGSITGAPKKRAREIIAELEPEPRGLYTGTLGYFGFNGESQFNIAIRTVEICDGVAQFHVGAGIVADSDPAREYQETLHKAAGILLAAERMSNKHI